MLFRLGAQLGENFNGTFSSAQRVLQTTQKEIQALNKTQSEIGAYQKQQQSIEKTNERLELYQKKLAIVQKEMAKSGEYSSGLAKRELELQQCIQNSDKNFEHYQKELDNVQKEMAESSKYSASLASQEIELQQRIRDAEEAIVTKNGKLAEMSNKLNEAGVNVNDLTAESARLETEMNDLQEEEEKAAAEAARFGDEGTTAFEAVGSALVSAGIAAALNKIADEYRACVEASMEFGYTMSTVEALSGASVTEMQTLTATAKELGATTAFTAKQSAQAMTYMGMAGWNAGQMVSGMDGVLNLAAASGEDLANVSDIVTDNLTAFGLKASDTAHFADVLAAAATNSNTSVGIMGETFSGSAAIAGALGYSIEDVAVAVGEMANAGVKGSVAGTALKNMFNGLLGGATLTSSAFGDVEFSAINADGTMKGFSETIDELRGYFDQMTEAERVNNAMTIAGQRGYNGLLAILNTTDEDYQKLSDSINNCTGSAQKMANIKLDNLQGDVTLLNSATDGLRMTIGGLYEDELRQAAQIGTEIITGINEFIEQNPVVVKAIMASVATLGGLALAYGAVNTAKKVKNALDALGITLSAAHTAGTTRMTFAESAHAAATTIAAKAQAGWNAVLAASPLIGLVVAVTAATTVISALRAEYQAHSLETQTLNTATKEQRDKVSQLSEEYEKACEIYGEADTRTRALKYDLDEANSVIDEQSFSVKELYAEIDALSASSSAFLEEYGKVGAEYDDQRERVSYLTSKLKTLNDTSEKTGAAQAQIGNIVERLNEEFPSLGITVEEVNNNLDGTINRIDRVLGADNRRAKAENANKNLLDLQRQAAAAEEAYKQAEVAQESMRKKYLDEVGKVTTQGALFTTIKVSTSGIEDDLDEANAKASEAYQMWQRLQAEVDKAETIVADYYGFVTGTSDEIISAYDAMQYATAEVTAETEELLKAYNDAYQVAYDSVSGQYALWDKAAEVSAVSVGTINENLEQQAAYWDSYNTNLNSLLGRAGEIDGLKDVLAAFADGGTDSVNAVAGMASASDEELKRMVENWQMVQEEQNKTAEALADTKVDFKERMDGIADDMNAAIEKMNLSAEAKTAAEETIKAYAEAIAAGKGSVAEAADIVAAAVGNALGISLAADNAVTPGGEYVRGFHEIDAHYADGTDYAKSGYALVGEEGPELVKFSGGEKVFPNDKTMAILGNSASNTGGQTVINISPQFTINGSADAGMVEEASERLIELVMDGLREAGIDARRGAYV